MKIALIDKFWEYNINTPYTEPLGGTQSAICYFLEELALKNNDVYLINNIKEPCEIKNVKHIPHSISINYIKSNNLVFDCIITSCLANDLLEYKTLLNNDNTLFCLWTGHDVDQEASKLLNNMMFMEFVDLYIFVSDWQRNRYIDTFNIPYDKTIIMRNGIGKPFEDNLNKPLNKVKNSMTYCSIPWRGLDLLNPIFKTIKNKYTNASLKIYSGMNIYKQQDTNIELYEEFKQMESVTYNQGISQTELAKELLNIEYLTYPNTFQETSCITVLQAMASGCLVVTSDLGALKESMNGLNKYIDINIRNFNKNKYINDFIVTFDNLINLSDNTKELLVKKNIQYIKENYTWSVICAQFERDINQKIIDRKEYIGEIYLKNINEGLNLFKNGKWIESIKYLQSIKTFTSLQHFNIIKLNIGVCYFKLNMLNEAHKYFKIAKKLVNDFNINKNIALLELSRNNIEKFLKHGFNALKFQFDTLFANLVAENLDKENIYHEGLSLYKNILKIDPNNVNCLNNLGNLSLFFLATTKNIDDKMTETYGKSFDICCKLNEVRKQELVFSNIIFNNLYNWNLSEKEIFRRSCLWPSKFPKKPELLKIMNSYNKLNKHDKIRIGYVSTDFLTHPVGFMFNSILKNHDMNSFEIFCYDNSSADLTNDSIANQLRSYNNAKWYKVAPMSNEVMLQTMVNDDLDIIIDMMGHTRNTRLNVLQYKPAKIMISYFAYPSTNGFKEMDYKFTDIYATPPETQKYFTEKLYYLPNGFQCYTPPKELDGTKRYNRDKYKIHLCCFNNPIKLSIPTIRTFVNVLKQLPEAKLFLRYIYYKSSFYKEHIIKLFVDQGIDRERIDISFEQLVNCLDMYNDMDIVLDPFPYNGGTITSEALYMNTPMITLEGTNYVSRVGVSLLSNLGLQKYIAKTEKEYVQKVVDLARNTDELKELHKSIRNKMLKSDLADTVSFTKNIEKAYFDMMNTFWIKNNRTIEL
jgi:glycosyltransferase involved in cell wall biosynthesis